MPCRVYGHVPAVLCLLLALSYCHGLAGARTPTAQGDNNGTYLVNSLNLLDAMKLSGKASPKCAAALARIKPNSNAAVRAELFSGRVIESRSVVMSYLSKLFLRKATDAQYESLIAMAFAPYSTLGNADACRSYYLPGFHYCRIEVFNVAYRWGVCVPAECDGDDVLHSVLNVPRILAQATSVCGTHHFPATPATYFAYAVLLLLALLAAAGTYTDVAERRAKRELDGSIKQSGNQRTSRWTRVVKAWSLVTNYEILTRPTKFDDFTVLHGVRALSMLWVILGHAFSGYFQVIYPTDNERMIISTDHHHGFLQRWASAAFPGAFMAVDAFFFKSAFLGTYQLLLHLDKLRERRPTGQRWLKRYAVEMPAIYLYRLLRISPTYYFVLLVYIAVWPTLITGVPYRYVQDDLSSCHKYWWMNILYIQNLRPNNALTPCYVPTWYLAADTQLFFFLPLLALLAFYSQKAGIAACLVVIVSSMTSAVLHGEREGWTTLAFQRADYVRYYNRYYQKPWYRASSYMLGIICGIIWVRHGEQLKAFVSMQHKARRRLAWSLLLLFWALAFVCSAVYVNARCLDSVPCSVTQLQMAVFISICWPFFIIGLALLCFFLFLRLDYGFIIRPLLESRPLVLLSRLSFTLYLVHYAIIVLVVSGMTEGYSFTEARFINDYIGFVASSTLAAILLHLLVERPFATLADLLRPRDKAEGGEEEKDKGSVVKAQQRKGDEGGPGADAVGGDVEVVQLETAESGVAEAKVPHDQDLVCSTSSRTPNSTQ